mmetsp:Transcript_28277/g.41649  ORF Transcript_28277/g.41649 Transcript_28277/m.41649 type:complete len:86 (-) Transcript_28277:9-266(-)
MKRSESRSSSFRHFFTVSSLEIDSSGMGGRGSGSDDVIIVPIVRRPRKTSAYSLTFRLSLNSAYLSTEGIYVSLTPQLRSGEREM